MSFPKRNMSYRADNITSARLRRAFTLIELLLVISIIAMLTSIIAPSLIAAKEKARSVVCLGTLHSISTGMNTYHTLNKQRFWPYRLANPRKPGMRCYWWGTDDDPGDAAASPVMEGFAGMLGLLWCPSLPWGSYTPQGSYVSEPTTTYGYNAYYLDPSLNGRKTKRLDDITNPAYLFVFNDAAMFWTVAGKDILQNSTYLEPVSGNWVQQPTTHFRHNGRTNALTADGHAWSYDTEGWQLDTRRNLGFVGTQNYPHYAQ